MKRVPLYRAPIAGLMSLALIAPAISSPVRTDPLQHANKSDDKNKRILADDPKT